MQDTVVSFVRTALVIVIAAALGFAVGGRSSHAVDAARAGSVDTLLPRDAGRVGDSVGFDGFDRAALGPRWDVHFGDAGIVRGRWLGLVSGRFALLSWAASVPADQFSEAQIVAGADEGERMDKGVFVRRRSDGARYQFHYDTNGTEAEPRPHWQLKYDGVPTPQTRILASNLSARAPVAGDTLRIEAQGQELRGYLDGRLILSARDGAIAAGTVGVALLRVEGVTAPTAVFERWLGGRLPRLLELRRTGPLMVAATPRPACFAVRFVSNTRSRYSYTVANARKRVVSKTRGMSEAGRPTVVAWCGRRGAKTPTRGEPLAAGRYRGTLELFVAAAGGAPGLGPFFARTWSLELRR